MKEHPGKALEYKTSGLLTNGFFALSSGFFSISVRFAFCWLVWLLLLITLFNRQAGMKCPQMCLLFHSSRVLSFLSFFFFRLQFFRYPQFSKDPNLRKRIAVCLPFRFADCSERNPCSLNAQAPGRGFFLSNTPGPWVLAARHRQRNER